MYFSTILASILIGFSILMLVFPIGFKVLMPQLFEPRTLAMFLPMEFGLTIVCFGAWMLLMIGSYNAGRNIFVGASFLITFASIFLTGGFPASIVIPCLIILPVIVHLLYGDRAGWVAAGGILALMGLQWAIVVVTGVELPDFTSSVSPNINIAIVFLVSFGAIQSAVAFYQRQNHKLNEEVKVERRNLEHIANHDSLTGLINPRCFYDRLEQQKNEASLSGAPCAIVYLDLDDFKQVNDNHGHLVGDLVLKKVASRLKSCVAEKDIVARMGGDEFAILVTSLAGDEALKELRARLQRAICQPLDVDGTHCIIGTSIGYAIFPDDAVNSQDLLQKADQDMYRDKSLKNLRQPEAPESEPAETNNTKLA